MLLKQYALYLVFLSAFVFSGSNLAFSQTATPTPVCSGYFSLNFDGIAQFAQVPGSASNSTAGAITVEAWIKWDGQNTGSSFEILSKAGSNDEIDFWLDENTGKIGFGFYESDDTPHFLNPSGTTTVLNANQWYHVAAVFIPSTSISIYVNGVLDGQLVTSIPATRRNNIGNNWYIGSYSDDTAPFSGNIDEVRISSVARYTGSFTPQLRFFSDASTEGLYHFDEGTGQVIGDSSSFLNNGVLGYDSSPDTDDPTWSTDLPGGGCPTPTPTATPTEIPTPSLTPTPTVTPTILMDDDFLSNMGITENLIRRHVG